MQNANIIILHVAREFDDLAGLADFTEEAIALALLFCRKWKIAKEKGDDQQSPSPTHPRTPIPFPLEEQQRRLHETTVLSQSDALTRASKDEKARFSGS